VGAGLLTAAIDAASGEKAKTYVPQVVGSAAGTFIDTLLTPVLGPLMNTR
jgi:hypothetical protein